MKKIIFLLIFLFSTLTIFSQSGGWQWVHPKPQGETVRNFKMLDANNWFVMCDYGVLLKTSNAGVSWSSLSIGYQSTLYPGAGILQSLYSGWFFDANNFLLGSQSSRGVVRSTNGGLTYDTIQVLATGSGTIYDFHFINSLTGYFCGTSSFKLQKTTNAGLSWSLVPNLGTATLYSVYASDTNNIILTSTSGNTYYTTNAGVNWTTSNVGATSTLYASKWINSTTGYLCGSSGCFRYTTNGGVNWQGSNPSTTTSMNRVLVNGSDIYIGGTNQNYIYKSTNNGTTWDSIAFTSAGQYTTFVINAMDILGANILAAGTYGIMNKTTNGGANWVTVTSHTTLANMVDIYAASGNGRVIAIGSNTGSSGAVIFSTNGGNTWSQGTGAVPNNVLSQLYMRNSSTGYVIGRFGIFWKTTNGGVTWDTSLSSNPALTPYFCNGVDFIDDNTGWIVGGIPGTGGTTLIFKTTNAGVNWFQQTSAYPNQIAVRIKMINASTGFIAGQNQFQKTTNGGTNWVLSMSGLPVNPILNSLTAVDPNNIFVTTSNSEVFASSDGGASWTDLNFPLTNIGTLFCNDFINSSTGMVAGIFGTVGKTTNRGVSWEISHTGGYTTMGIDMLNSDTAFAVCGNISGGQVFKYVRSLTGGVITWNNEIPSGYSLKQNFPNPFNPSTKIIFSLPKESNVTLKIFDITGREVTTLINNISFRSGIITYDFDGSEFSSGVYFYSLFADNNKIDTKKMILLK